MSAYDRYWYVYILRCKDNFFYTGMTSDLAKRFEQHLSGQGSKYTTEHGVGEIVYVETCESYEEVWLREKQIKDYSRKKKYALIEKYREQSRDRSKDER